MNSTSKIREETLVEVWKKLTELKEDAERGARLSYEGAAYYTALQDAADDIHNMMSEETRNQLRLS